MKPHAQTYSEKGNVTGPTWQTITVTQPGSRTPVYVGNVTEQKDKAKDRAANEAKKARRAAKKAQDDAAAAS